MDILGAIVKTYHLATLKKDLDKVELKKLPWNLRTVPCDYP